MADQPTTADATAPAANGAAASTAPAAGAPADAKPALTQDQVNAVIAAERRKEREKAASERAELERSLKERDAQLEELKAQVESFGKPEAERTKAAEERAAKRNSQSLEQANKDRADALSQATSAKESLKTYVVRQKITEALAEAKCIPGFISQAALLMQLEGSPELSFDNDDVMKPSIKMTIGGALFDDPKKAAAQWLKANPHFVPASPGGAGSRAPNAGGGGPVDFNAMTPEQAAAHALRMKAQT